jgi:hypothetical protein
VIKSVRDLDQPETCVCGSTNTERTIAVSQAFSKMAAGDWNSAHYSPALGKVVKNNAEARRLAKERGMIEVGTESVEKIHAKYDTERQKKAEQGWDDITRSLTNLGEIG